MKTVLLLTVTVLINLTSTCGQSQVNYVEDQGIVRKSTSHYFINDSTLVVDSMFVTLSYFDKTGTLQKVEETHYLPGKKLRSYTALYRDDDHLFEMRENGRLMIRNEFDSYGTIIKSVALINHNRDSIVTTYIPEYVNERLIQRSVAQKTSHGVDKDIEYYQYQSFPDSSITTSTIKRNNLTLVEAKCYNGEKKLVYITNTLKMPGMDDRRSSLINKYDATKNLIEIVRILNDRVIASEIFYYKDGKLTSSISHKKGIIIKTAHEF